MKKLVEEGMQLMYELGLNEQAREILMLTENENMSEEDISGVRLSLTGLFLIENIPEAQDSKSCMLRLRVRKYIEQTGEVVAKLLREMGE